LPLDIIMQHLMDGIVLTINNMS